MSLDSSQPLVENPFLKQLLTLQQDGNAAISAPTTWGTPPLLRVETELDQVVDNLVASICEGNRNRETARWHFFVGSPGNGKSAGTGELARRLLGAGFIVKDSEGTSLEELPGSAIPYELQVFEPGRNYACAFIAQDASVVPNPYADDANPATALTELLQRAADKGVSLIVCTNRGVLERAFAAHYLVKSSNGKIWFEAIKASVLGQGGFNREFENADRRTFKSVAFAYTSLDRRSLLIGRSTFDQLVERATEEGNWAICQGCPARSYCPFFQNRRWLADPALRTAFTKVIGQAEILSGQVIVFREALALLSLILAGCPHDFPDGSPCRWVHSGLATGDLFPLLSRRVYMILFSAYAPLGIEPFEDDRLAQKEAIGKLARAVAGPHAQLCHKALRGVLATAAPISSDVGVERLVGYQGILRTIDPFSDVQANIFYERWDDAGGQPFRGDSEWISELERACARVWEALTDTAETRREGLGATYQWLSRWITSFTHRAGALLDQSLTFSAEVEHLVKILSLADPPDEDGLRLVEQIQRELWNMLHGGGEGTQISPFARLKGEWVKTKLRPKIDRGANAGGQSIVLHLKFGDHTQIPLNTMAFVWLKRRADRAMSDARFPVEYLETAGDALVRAASESKYFLENSDIELLVSLPDGRKASLKRSHGRVIIDGL